jgi:NAD(P)H dehydrogenase (quinone)
MRCLIITAHPLAQSFCQALANKAANTLIAAKHECRRLDLYASHFSPVLTREERESYYTSFDTSQVTNEVEDLLWAEAIVLVFPTWWFGLPAILKGWFDRVWAPGVAYDHAADLGAIQPRLRRLRKVVAITTLGSPWWVDWLVFWQPVRRILKTAILRTCAPQASLTFLSFYKCKRLSSRHFGAALLRVETTLKSL